MSASCCLQSNRTKAAIEKTTPSCIQMPGKHMLALGSPSANWKLWLFASAMDSRRNKVHNRIYHCSFTSRNVGRWDSCSQEFLEDRHRLGIELVFHIFPRSDFLWIHQIQQRTLMDETAERTQMRMHLWRPLHLWHPCS